jgi:hypothetical protein
MPMSEQDFFRFCNAIAQSYARQATELQQKAQRLPKDEVQRSFLLEERSKAMSDHAEVWANAHTWF